MKYAAILTLTEQHERGKYGIVRAVRHSRYISYIDVNVRLPAIGIFIIPI
jgi:hypothetical protein